MSDKPELKPCPFCGKLASTYKDSDGKWTIICSFSDCLIVPFGRALNEQSVIDAWNQRADLAKPSEWISVETELPCKSDDVILWNGSDREIYLCYEREHFEAYYKDITHWALLIEPPTRETP